MNNNSLRERIATTDELRQLGEKIGMQIRDAWQAQGGAVLKARGES